MPRVLILDDEPLIAMMVQGWLTELGHDVIGPANSVAAALDLIVAELPDAAMLDLSLGKEDAYPVADALNDRKIPFVFLTGHGANRIAARFNDMPILSKPFDFKDIEGALSKLLTVR